MRNRVEIPNDDDDIDFEEPLDLGREIINRVENVRLDMDKMESQLDSIVMDLRERVPEIKTDDLPIIALGIELLLAWAANPELYLTELGAKDIIGRKDEITERFGCVFPKKEMVKDLYDEIVHIMTDKFIDETVEDIEEDIDEDDEDENLGAPS